MTTMPALTLSLQSYVRLGELFIKTSNLSYHNLERFIAVELWLTDRISTQYVKRLLMKYTSMQGDYDL